jgi:hypothetical protein
VFEHRVLRKIFGPKGDEVTGQWRRLNNKGLHDFCSSPNIIRVIKSKWMRWVWYVAHTEEKRNSYRFLWANLNERDHWVALDIGGRIMFNLI